MMRTLLVTVDSLRYDYYQYMDATRAYLGDSHPHAYATSPMSRQSIPALLTGVYPPHRRLPTGNSIAASFETAVGITANARFSAASGVDDGFDIFDAPTATAVTRPGVPLASSRTSTTSIGSTVRRLYDRARSHFTSTSKSFRHATDVVNAFLAHIQPDDEWFGWLHFMEPHHPYDPRPAQRLADRRLTQTVFADNGTFDDEAQVRRLYRREIETLDDALAGLWTSIPDDTRVIFCGDHGTLLGEDFQWGQSNQLRAELLRVPLATTHAPAVGDVVSLIDIPSLLLGEASGAGTLTRNVAYAIAGDTVTALNTEHITRGDGVERLYTGTSVNDEELAAAHTRFDPQGAMSEDGDGTDDDAETRGYA